MVQSRSSGVEMNAIWSSKLHHDVYEECPDAVDELIALRVQADEAVLIKVLQRSYGVVLMWWPASPCVVDGNTARSYCKAFDMHGLLRSSPSRTGTLLIDASPWHITLF